MTKIVNLGRLSGIPRSIRTIHPIFLRTMRGKVTYLAFDPTGVRCVRYATPAEIEAWQRANRGKNRAFYTDIRVGAVLIREWRY